MQPTAVLSHITGGLQLLLDWSSWILTRWQFPMVSNREVICSTFVINTDPLEGIVHCRDVPVLE